MASINGKERIHCCHTFRRWSWISSCHSTVSFQSSCINTLIGRTYGDRNPRGSNSKLMVERILRLVAGLSVGTVLRQKTSLSASQCRPNVDWSAVCLVRGWGLGWPYLVMAVPAELLFDCSSIAQEFGEMETTFLQHSSELNSKVSSLINSGSRLKEVVNIKATRNSSETCVRYFFHSHQLFASSLVWATGGGGCTT